LHACRPSHFRAKPTGYRDKFKPELPGTHPGFDDAQGYFYDFRQFGGMPHYNRSLICGRRMGISQLWTAQMWHGVD
jgi:hypothetical protein